MVPQGRTPYFWIVFIAGLIGGSSTAVFLGQDINWDLQNYHLYVPHALFSGRHAVDLMPAGIAQTYLNPILYFYPYLLIINLSPLLASALIGMVHGGNLVLVWGIAHRVLWTPDPGEDGHSTRKSAAWHYLVCIAVTTVGMTAPIYLSVIGTSFADPVMSLLILGAAYLAIPLLEDSHGKSPWSISSLQRIVMVGFLTGAAAGLKLVGLLYVTAMVIAMIVALPPGQKGRLLSGNIAGSLLGLAVTGGPWAIFVYSRWGNPVYPFYNGIFRSPYFPKINFSDSRWIPDSVVHAFSYPFQWASGHHPTAEIAFRDWRFALISLLVPTAFMAIWWKRKGKRMANMNATRRHLFIATYFLSAYVIWLFWFAQRRFIISLELISGVMIASAVSLILSAGVGRRLAILLLCAIAVATTSTGSWGRVDWGGDWFEVQVPQIPGGDEALYVMTSGNPYSFIIPFMPPQTRFVRPEILTKAFMDKAAEMIARHPGVVRTLAPAEHPSAVLGEVALARMDSYINYSDCTSIGTRLGPIESCEIVRKADKYKHEMVSIEFNEVVPTSQYMGLGWSSPEPWGIWTLGTTAQVKIPLPRESLGLNLELQLKADGFVADQIPLQEIQVQVNGIQLAPAHFDIRRPTMIITRTLPSAVFAESTDLDIVFKISNPTSPASIGTSKDDRELGLGLHWLRIVATDG